MLQAYRQSLYAQQRGHCFWCDRVMHRKPQSRKKRRNGQLRALDVTLDHVTPKCRGGTDDRTNLVAACLECNPHRGNMDAEAFGRLMWTRSAVV